MINDDNHSREGKIRERIVSVIRASEQVPGKQIAAEELQKLKTAASRLDQMLKATAEAEVQVLRSASARLDQILENLRCGKDVVSARKRDGD
jgi:hypothetical protein